MKREKSSKEAHSTEATDFDRFYPNPYATTLPDFNLVDMVTRMRHFITKAYERLDNAIGIPSRSMDMYMGKVGIAMTLARMEQFAHFFREGPLEYRDLSSFKKHTMENSSGIGLGSDLICYSLYECLSKNIPFELPIELTPSISSTNTKQTSKATSNTIYSDEILYGKAGLALLLTYFQKKGLVLTKEHVLSEVIGEIHIEEFPWKWHNKVYFGAAHGTAGILLILTRLGKQMHPELLKQLIELSLLDSGNFASSLQSQRDSLVQWCHGAPGFIPLLLEYQEYLPASEHNTLIDVVLSVIWQRGFLKKGEGICHGLAGNGYVFLSTYLTTKEPVRLIQALCFAQEILNKGIEQCCYTADRPDSMFEGLSGVVHFILDLIQLLQDRIEDRPHDPSFELFDGLNIF